MNIRPYSSGDEIPILELDAKELPSIWNRRTLQNWQWKFTEKNPAGHSKIWVAEHKGKMIAHFAAVPYKVKVFGEEVTASHSIGALVDSDYQNRGLLKFVGDKLLEDLSNDRITFTWGFPNQRAYKFEKIILGYQDLISFDEWSLREKEINRTFPSHSFSKITEFCHDFEELWEECKGDYNIIVKRDRAYLKWRYIDRPDAWYYPYAIRREGVLKGYIVLKLYREEEILRGHIIDIFAGKDDRQTFSELLEGSINFFTEHCVNEIKVWIWGNPLIEEIFIKKGFIRSKNKRPLIIHFNKNYKHMEKVLDNSNWFFTMGDSTEIF